MAEAALELKELDSQDHVQTMADIFVASLQDERGVRKEFVQDFFTSCLNNLENQATSPKTKFYTILLLRELSNKEKTTLKIFGTFSNHPLYAYLEDTALRVDPRKPISEKGKAMFAGDKETGNNFMRLLLESLVTWGTRFPTNSKKEPTKFKRTLTRLNDEKVTLPKDFIYYTKKNSEKPEQPEPKKEQPRKNETPTGPPPATGLASKEKYASELRFMRNKIDTLLGALEDAEDADELQREVQASHLKFEKDLGKMEQQQLEMIEGQPEDIVELYFKILEFLNEERGLYRMHAAHNDMASYSSGYAIAYEKLFEPAPSPPPPPPPPKSKAPSTLKEVSKDISIDAKISGPLPPPPDKSKTSLNDQSRDKESREKENLSRKASQREKPAPTTTATRLAVENCFSRLDNYSKSAVTGFAAIAKSLSREKQSTIAPRAKNLKISSLHKASKMGASVSGSMARSGSRLKGIFAAPPNPSPPTRTYEGELVVGLSELQRVSEGVRREQGQRRFKMSHMRDKYLLYEDDVLQIGFKSTQIYEKVERFSSLLSLQLFIGNKTEIPLRSLKLYFQGDHNLLVYTSPQTIDSVLAGNQQAKMEVLCVPRNMPFGLVTLHVNFEQAGVSRQAQTVLPSSLLKFVTYYSLEEPNKLPELWSECVRKLKTEPFRLSHYFPPDQLASLIPQLTPTNDYSVFTKPGSTTDYELACEVVIQQSFEAVLRVKVRPDLTVVLQAGLYQDEENAVRNFKLYLQTLEMLLKQAD